MLHEVRHLKHQQYFTSTAHGDASELARAEEISCDRFAAEYLIEFSARYASALGTQHIKVRMKRALGVYFGTFALIVLGHANWEESESHPSVSERLRAMRSLLSADGLPVAREGAAWGVLS